LGISGFLAIISENQPRKVLLKVCLACSLLGVVITAIQLIIYLLDLAKMNRINLYCNPMGYKLKCYQRADKE
ncbi:hypothetical protein scyTo_0024050, partial [Scyliorhinus torazame]|nr:hypothetical protein [Scyliorhinus torazame]